jgi:osmotically inducible lipoprotein OsmB
MPTICAEALEVRLTAVNDLAVGSAQEPRPAPTRSGCISKESLMRAITSAAILVLAAASLTACGHNMEQKAATGAATGMLVAGPIGAAVGAGVGAVTQKAEDGGAIPKQGQ